ncbi:hypothetical protein L4D13_18425 [Photobacterium profundum]|uniref:hypothetical protein n=1 Tax=Photobacterium profundum TaxID=74109 RepID=UPI003D097E38
MEILVVTLQVIILLAIGCLVLFRKMLFSYSSEKGKNLATKEDISQITDKIEVVKLDYAKQLESTKADLSVQLNNHGYRYEKEYEVLAELTSNLVDLRNIVLQLRPQLDFVDPTKDKEAIKQERLNKYFEARRELFFTREKKRPFYPSDIYEAVLDVDKAAQSESIEYEYRDPMEEKNHREYWENADKKQKEIIANVEIAMEKIRSRVTYWEAITSNSE